MKKLILSMAIMMLVAILATPLAVSAEQGEPSQQQTGQTSQSTQTVQSSQASEPSQQGSVVRQAVQAAVQAQHDAIQARRVALKAALEAGKLSRFQLKTETKTALQAERDKIDGYKSAIRDQLALMKDMTAEERLAMRAEIDTLREECKAAHMYCLEIRAAAKEEKKQIRQTIRDILPDKLTAEETVSVGEIISDIV